MTSPRLLNDSSAVLDDLVRICRELRANNPELKSLLISGVSGGEGATSVAATFAMLCARENLQVVVVDGRFRKQELQTLFASLDTGMDIPHVPKVYEHSLSDEKSMTMRALNQHLKSYYDWVIWDCPALSQHTDFIELAGFVDGVLLVLEADQTKVDVLAFLKERLDRAKANIVGAVINRSGRYLPNKIVRRWFERRKKARQIAASAHQRTGYDA